MAGIANHISFFINVEYIWPTFYVASRHPACYQNKFWIRSYVSRPSHQKINICCKWDSGLSPRKTLALFTDYRHWNNWSKKYQKSYQNLEENYLIESLVGKLKIIFSGYIVRQVIRNSYKPHILSEGSLCLAVTKVWAH